MAMLKVLDSYRNLRVIEFSSGKSFCVRLEGTYTGANVKVESKRHDGTEWIEEGNFASSNTLVFMGQPFLAYRVTTTTAGPVAYQSRVDVG